MTRLNQSMPIRMLRASITTLCIGLPVMVNADAPVNADIDVNRNGVHASPLVNKVRQATARYRDINSALNDFPEPWVRATPCVSGPNQGAMGIHLVKPSRIGDGEINSNAPEALIYEPLPNGAYRLVGVEFIVIAQDWEARHPGTTPSVDGNLANLVPAPNRYGLPAFYELHVWAWQNNPQGTFADWNTRVTCDHTVATE